MKKPSPQNEPDAPMTTIDHDRKMLERRQDLTARRTEILRLTPEDALKHILAHSQPAALVHTFAEEDLHILMHELRPDDALPLLPLASHRQLEYVLDQELWQRDRFDLAAARQWLERLLEADEPSQRLVRWLAEAKADLVELVLCRSIEVRMREHDQDPTVFGPDFFTYDSVFYIRIVTPPHAPDREPPSVSGTSPRDSVRRLLDQLAETDYLRFQAILLEAIHLLPAETEEEAYRLRNVRLAEKGFLPFEEAVGLYQPLNEQIFRGRARRKAPMEPDHPDHFPMVPAAVLPGGSLFARALASIASSVQRQTLQEEFASLCNRIIVADRKTIRRRDDLTDVVAKASGYISIGLEREQTAGLAAQRQLASAVQALCDYNLEALFRLGYHQAVQLKREIETWVPNSWFAGCGLPLTFWGEQWLGIMGGLLIKRPLFFDQDQKGTHYREFASAADVEGTRRQLRQIQTLDRLLGAMNLDRRTMPTGRFITFYNLLLTLWARHRLGLAEEVRPLTTEAFRPFFTALFADETRAEAPDRRRRIAANLKNAFLHWLAERSQESAERIARALGTALDGLFEELEDHYGRVPPDHLDPRYIPHFMLEPSTSHPR